MRVKSEKAGVLLMIMKVENGGFVKASYNIPMNREIEEHSFK